MQIPSTLTSIDNSVVDAATIAPVEPVLPGFRTHVTRKIFEVVNFDSMQTFIDSAVDWETAHPGARPIVHISGQPNMKKTANIPAHTDIQIMGSSLNNRISWNGLENASFFIVNGPTKVTFSYLGFYGWPDPAHIITVKNCDQAGSRLLFKDNLFNHGLCVNGAVNMDVTAHTWLGGGGTDAAPQIKVVGSKTQSGTSRTALFGCYNIAGAPAYEIVNGGRLLVQDAYSEMFWGSNRYLYCHGAGVQPGQVSLEILSNETDAAGRYDSTFYFFDNWKGSAAMLSGNAFRKNCRIAAADNTAGALMNLLALGSTFPAPLTYPTASSHVYYTNRISSSCGSLPAINANVADTTQFVRDVMSFRREQKALPYPLAAVPSGASDIQIFRLGNESQCRSFDVYVEGSDPDSTSGVVVFSSNYIKNGSFEIPNQNFSNWGGGGYGMATDTNNKTDGRYAIKFTASSGANGAVGMGQWLSAVPNADTSNRWYVEFDVKVPAGDSGALRMWENFQSFVREDSLIVSNTATRLLTNPGSGYGTGDQSRVTATPLTNGFTRIRINLGNGTDVTATSFQLSISFNPLATSTATPIFVDNFVLANLNNTGIVRFGRTPVHSRGRLPLVFNAGKMVVIRDLPGNADVKLFNAAGKMIVHRGSTGATNSARRSERIDNLSNGFYILSIKSNGLVLSEHIAIIK